jgi:hypothetical protein
VKGEGAQRLFSVSNGRGESPMIDWRRTRLRMNFPTIGPRTFEPSHRRIEPVWDQGRYGSAILGRQAGQDAQHSSARWARALDRWLCSGRCFRHVPSQLLPFRAREVGLSKKVTRKALWRRVRRAAISMLGAHAERASGLARRRKGVRRRAVQSDQCSLALEGLPSSARRWR